MSLQEKALVLTAAGEMHDAVGAVLNGGGRYACNGACRNLAELSARLESQAFSVVLVDIDAQPERILAELGPVISRFSDPHFVVLSGQMRGEWVLAAMRAGARNFVLKSDLDTELPAVLDQLPRPDAAEPSGTGVIVTVLASAGGCGATTMAVNLADELRLASGEQTMVMDMDCFYGSVGSYLGIEGMYGLAEVLNHRGQIDPALLASTAMQNSEGLHVLLSPASTNFEAPQSLDYSHMNELLDSCRQAFAFTVIDAPRIPIEVATTLAAHSTMTLLVLQLSVKDVRVARAMMAGLTARGIRWESIRPLINRYRRKRWTVGLEDAQKALGMVPTALIRNDFRSASAALNYGKCLAQVARKSKLREDISQLAAMIIHEWAQNAREAAR